MLVDQFAEEFGQGVAGGKRLPAALGFAQSAFHAGGQRVEGRSKVEPESSPGCWIAKKIVLLSGVKQGPQTSAPVGA